MRNLPLPNGTSAAIVGSRGFLGRALAVKLRSAGDTVLEYDKGELTPTALAELTQVNTIFWAASTINPAIAETAPEKVIADHGDVAEFLTNLIKINANARFVFFSSGGTVYGRGVVPFRETSPTHPISAYGKAKLALEETVTSRFPNSVILRIANAYGPGQHPAPGQGVISHWLQAVAQRKPLKIIGDLHTIRDYLFIDDLTTALVQVHQAQEMPRVMNLGSNTPTTLSDVLAAVENAVSQDALAIEQVSARSFDLGDVWLDSTLAQQHLKWCPKVSLTEGIRETWNWIKT